MLCAVGLCAVVLCAAVLCAVVLCAVVLCAAVLCAAVLCSVVLCAVVPCDVYSTYRILNSMYCILYNRKRALVSHRTGTAVSPVDISFPTFISFPSRYTTRDKFAFCPPADK